jgi:hypothetical protein
MSDDKWVPFIDDLYQLAHVILTRISGSEWGDKVSLSGRKMNNIDDCEGTGCSITHQCDQEYAVEVDDKLDRS